MAKRISATEASRKFADMLRVAGVYKRDERGRRGFRAFLQRLGFA